jgi:hypothetical protein
MTLHNYIRKKFHNDIAFAKFNCNINFISNDILHNIVTRSGNYKKY